MAAGTAASLVPIKSITLKSGDIFVKYQDGGDTPGPVIVKLLEQLKGLQQGKVKDTFGWVEKVGAHSAGEGFVSGATGEKGVNGKTLDQLP